MPPEMPEVNIKWDSPQERMQWHSARPDLATDDELDWAKAYILATSIGGGVSIGAAGSDFLLPHHGRGPKIPRAGLFGTLGLLGGFVNWAKYAPSINAEIEKRQEENNWNPTGKSPFAPRN